MTRSKIDVNNWDVAEHGLLSEAVIRRLHVPARRYRIATHTYPAGTQTGGTMMPAICYVLAGTCRYTFDVSVDISASQFATLPAGGFTLSVVGNEEVKIVLVWALPFALPDEH